jgi:transglutaminase-like putative cysteine protease
MHYDIIHRSSYFYSSPVRESVMELWLKPMSLPRQRVISFDIVTSPPARLFSYEDWLGNVVHHFDVPEPHEQLSIFSRAGVQTSEPALVPDRVEPGDWLRLESDETKARYWDFLQPSHFVKDTPQLTRFMDDYNLQRGPDPLLSLRTLNEVMFESFEYQQGFTAADSPIDAALEHRKGVCQDFAHIMLSVARRWGIPARYVSGYLARPREGQDRSVPDASHAWVECMIPEIGWTGFDPTNNMLAGERHIVVAFGRDYADVPPTRGVLKGDADSHLEVSVEVRHTRRDPRDTDGIRVVKVPRDRPEHLARTQRSTPLDELVLQQQQQQQQ